MHKSDGIPTNAEKTASKWYFQKFGEILSHHTYNYQALFFNNLFKELLYKQSKIFLGCCVCTTLLSMHVIKQKRFWNIRFWHNLWAFYGEILRIHIRMLWTTPVTHILFYRSHTLRLFERNAWSFWSFLKDPLTLFFLLWKTFFQAIFKFSWGFKCLSESKWIGRSSKYNFTTRKWGRNKKK